MKQLNIGIIGLGAIGERLLRQFHTHPSTNIVAISDVNEQRMIEMKELVSEVNLYNNYKDLIANEEVELVYVAVPPKFHYSIALDVLNAGKHILCEKPLANSLEEAIEMKEKAEAAGVVNAINFPLPYSNPVNTLSNLIQKDEIGKLRRIELTMKFPEWPRSWQQNEWIARREQGGFIREITPHFIQLTQQLFGKVGNVQTFVEYPENEKNCETGVIARLQLEAGTPILVNGLSGVGQKEELSYKMIGENGVLSLVNWGQLTYTTMEKENETIAIRDNEQPGLIDELINAVSGKPSKLITFKEGYEVQRILEGLLG
ncbi:Gfo/Idh/MocA family protein [Ornithinibacillus halophilus]|uniref:Predicted dehydrogenase n=1 Tax=Ornithinibacillus halophilus TaxID=930117 RepID=A0A1M5KB77_9BACI|nr:Gfo/Idh/MocA family oxidoreductase [Ornithinibacillus halophilus]SHG50174.1 Predicted dehydrogenase [Ornithinibacillus halophilus]